MDYRELLKAYIKSVGLSEGVDFIDSMARIPDYEDFKLTKEQEEELKKLSKEVWGE